MDVSSSGVAFRRPAPLITRHFEYLAPASICNRRRLRQRNACAVTMAYAIGYPLGKGAIHVAVAVKGDDLWGRTPPLAGSEMPDANASVSIVDDDPEFQTRWASGLHRPAYATAFPVFPLRNAALRGPDVPSARRMPGKWPELQRDLPRRISNCRSFSSPRTPISHAVRAAKAVP
jgi:hypothetical protein